ncbi:uncharacterized protein EAE97_005962 [Botrytis byssoidea]|uniref:Uncharacterized protein n=1 Tax=Botrytis byssoidea TaxID=139641 RepID=A0A9P5IQD0_9HELO|nr:uncharacterized protein EAE97_005962 [Botrytis byssoidea]KAF7943892.1 hypothetical protein EAE97_005962 [Botrytis byssoidea]
MQRENQQSSSQEIVGGHRSHHHTRPESSSNRSRTNHSRSSSGENSESRRKRTKTSSGRTPARESANRGQELGTSSNAQAKRPRTNEGSRIADRESSPATGHDSRRYGKSTGLVAAQKYIPPRGPQTTEMQGIQERMARTYVSAPSIPAVHDPSSRNSALAPMFNNPFRSSGRFVGWGGLQEEQQWQQQEQQDHQQYLQPNATQQGVAIPAPQTSTSYSQQSQIKEEVRCTFHDEYGLWCGRPRLNKSFFCDITGSKAHNDANSNRDYYRGMKILSGSIGICPQRMVPNSAQKSVYICNMKN